MTEKRAPSVVFEELARGQRFIAAAAVAVSTAATPAAIFMRITPADGFNAVNETTGAMSTWLPSESIIPVG